MRLLLLLTASIAVLGLGCADERAATAPVPTNAETARFVDRAAALGVDFRHWNGMVGQLHFHELLGAGGAFLDYDNDGDLDLFLVQGAAADPDAAPLEPFPGPEPPRDRLYRNQLVPTGTLGFVDVTDEAELTSVGYGAGVATGDIDNDGWTDLYVTRFDANQLWRNRGPGPDGRVTFEDVTAQAGVAELRWSTSAAFVDVDRDGWLDLYVANYVDARVANHERCVNDAGQPEYCGPLSYPPLTDRLWRNRGSGAPGRFDDISGRVGLVAAPGPGLGVAIADVDDDGWPDIYVANDQAANQLWRNTGAWDGEMPGLVDEAILRGAAFDEQGRAQASMGVVAADFDDDGDDDLFMTHLLREVNTLYRNDGQGLFFDHSRASGLGNASIGATGFGTVVFDGDRDGWLDLVIANGAVRTIAEQRRAGVRMPLRQPDQLFVNRGGRFAANRDWAPALTTARVSRGAAVGDVDNDGDDDILLTHCDDAPALLIHEAVPDGGWLGLRVVDRHGRDAQGARVVVTASDGRRLTRRIDTSGSFLSAHDPRLRVGLGAAAGAAAVEVRWPTGEVDAWADLAPGRYHELRQASDADRARDASVDP
ncbi:MAG: CRTAC1 family protein [Acidobacteriota bacterium]